MIDPQVEETATLYATGALTPEENLHFEAQIRADPELAQVVGKLNEACSMLAFMGPNATPEPGTKERILQKIREEEGSPRKPAPVLIFPAWVSWAAAACLAILCAALWTQKQREQNRAAALAQRFAQLEQQFGELKSRNEALQTRVNTIPELVQQLETVSRRNSTFSNQVESLVSQLRQSEQLRPQVDLLTKRANDLAVTTERLRTQLGELQNQERISQMRISFLSSLIESSPNMQGVSVWDSEQQKGVLVTDKLPPLPAGKDYQLWVIDPKYPSPVSAGVFNVDPQGGGYLKFAPQLPVERAEKFAVTIEQKGGVAKPEGKMMLLSK